MEQRPGAKRRTPEKALRSHTHHTEAGKRKGQLLLPLKAAPLGQEYLPFV